MWMDDLIYYLYLSKHHHAAEDNSDKNRKNGDRASTGRSRSFGVPVFDRGGGGQLVANVKLISLDGRSTRASESSVGLSFNVGVV